MRPAQRWTHIDRAIQAKLIEGVIDLRRRQGNLETQVERNHMVGRLQHLERMGLAEESSTSVWSINPQAEPVLRAMGERGDIIRTMQRAFSNERRDFDIVGPTGPKTPIVGRIAAKGLARFKVPIEQMKMSANTKDLLRRTLFVEPLPFVTTQRRE